MDLERLVPWWVAVQTILVAQCSWEWVLGLLPVASTVLFVPVSPLSVLSDRW